MVLAASVVAKVLLGPAKVVAVLLRPRRQEASQLTTHTDACRLQTRLRHGSSERSVKHASELPGRRLDFPCLAELIIFKVVVLLSGEEGLRRQPYS